MEEKKEYLNEEEYQRNNAKLKKTGKIVLIVGGCMLLLGIILTIVGILSLGSTAINSSTIDNFDEVSTVKGIFGSFGSFALGGFMDVTGFFVMGIGGIIMFIAHRREIAAYTTQQVMPVAKEGAEKMAPTAGKVAKEVAKGIKEGINEADKEK